MPNDKPTTTATEITFYEFVTARLADGGSFADVHGPRVSFALRWIFDQVGGAENDPIARSIAAIFRHHADYNEEWRP